MVHTITLLGRAIRQKRSLADEKRKVDMHQSHTDSALSDDGTMPKLD